MHRFSIREKVHPFLFLHRPYTQKHYEKTGFLYRVFDLYYDGFRKMTLGKTLWTVILIKLFIMFAVLKMFFFPNIIKQKSKPGQEANFIEKELIDRNR